MALFEGNITTDVRIPAGTTWSFSHNQNTGSDGCLVVMIAIPAFNVPPTSVKYGGVSMTRKANNNNSNFTTNWSAWELKNPPTGVNTVLVTLSTGQWNNVSTVCYSFTGSSGVGNTTFNPTAGNPATSNITISSNSMVIGACIGGNGTNTVIEIPQGVARPKDWSHQINNWTWGGISPSLSAGTITIQGSCTALTHIQGVEVKEAAAPPVGNNTSGWFLIFN